MSDINNPNCGQVHKRPSTVLKLIETRAINIRKLLRQKENAIDQRAWGELDDAIRLATTIEAIASKAVNLSAADAINFVELLEIMLEQLNQNLARIFAP